MNKVAIFIGIWCLGVLTAQPVEFFQAVKKGEEQKVHQMLDNDKALVSLSEPGSGRTPLMWAVIKGHENIVKLLMDAGADREVQARNGKTALSFAVQKLFAKDTSYKTYQRIINRLGYVLIGSLEQLYPHREPVFFKGAYPGTIEEGYVFLDLWARETFTAQTFDELARENDDGDHIITALVGQPSPGKEYSIYFFDAASIHQWWRGRPWGSWHNPTTNMVTEEGNVLQYVLSYNADSDIITAYYVGTGVYTAVHPYRAGDARLFFKAISEKNTDEVARLLRKGIDVNMRDQGHTALMRAAHFAHPDIATVLLSDSDLEVNATGPFGYTALMEAIDNIRLSRRDPQRYQRYLEVIRLLLNDERIDRDVTNQFGKTAYDIAQEYDLEEVLNLFDATSSTAD